MIWKDRNGNIVPGDDGQDKMLEFLYKTRMGRVIVKIMIHPFVSKVAGFLMDSKISCMAINSFSEKNNIDLSEYEPKEYTSFNDFFTRKVLKEKRPVDMEPTHLIAPCDSKLCVYPISSDSTFTVKNTEYTLASLLKSKKLAKKYEGGTFLLFRLTVGDYHRFHYMDNGTKTKNRRIKGVFHTVNPIANDLYPIYKENTREYSILHSQNFGDVLIMEVGATMVGRIVNYDEEATVFRGQEKGRFEFGGSTVILCLEKDRAIIDSDIIENTKNDIETVVKYGEKIGLGM